MTKFENLPVQVSSVPMSPKSVVEELHARCGSALSASLSRDYETQLGQSYVFLGDIEAWKKVLNEQPEARLFETAAQEYAISLLNVCQGQYRNAFKGLRLVLELCLQGTHLSANQVLLSEWLKGDADTTWTVLVDAESGPLSKRFCSAFFPELLDHVANFREMAKTVYRELSECIHGNVPNHIPLPTSLAFDRETFLLWHDKANIVRLVVLFSLSVRYLSKVPEKVPIQSGLSAQLGHISAIRVMLGGTEAT